MPIRRNPLAALALAALALAASGLAAPARADYTLTALDSGHYDDSGSYANFNHNYLTGDNGSGQYRSFFVFDLSAVSGTIIGAELRLFNPAGGYSSPDDAETLTLFDVATPIATLRAGGDGLTSVYADLGSGTAYGASDVSSADDGRIVSVTLDASALASLGASRGQFAFGAALTTLSPGSVEYLFGGTGLGGDTRQLVVHTRPVPEPAGLAMLTVGILAMSARGRRPRRVVGPVRA